MPDDQLWEGVLIGHRACLGRLSAYLYWDYAFGSASVGYDLEMPGTADEALVWLADSQRPLSQTLDDISDGDLDQDRLTNWGETWPTTRIFTTLIKEQTHHGAEVSLLRDLYRNRASLAPMQR